MTQTMHPIYLMQIRRQVHGYSVECWRLWDTKDLFIIGYSNYCWVLGAIAATHSTVKLHDDHVNVVSVQVHEVHSTDARQNEVDSKSVRITCFKYS